MTAAGVNSSRPGPFKTLTSTGTLILSEPWASILGRVSLGEHEATGV